MRRVVLVALALSAPATAFAYIDPGTGALLVQGLIGALTAIALFWRRVMAYVRSIFVRESNSEQTASTDSNAINERHADAEEEA